MTTYSPKLLAISLLATSVLSFTATVSAATGLIDFEFDEGTGTKVTDRINSLVGAPGNPANPPTFVTDSPSGKTGDSAIHFEAGQYRSEEHTSELESHVTIVCRFMLQKRKKFP